MEFEWDEKKRHRNIEKHGFDFAHAMEVFTNKYVTLPVRVVGDEERFAAIGMLDGGFVTIIFTMREENYRIISMRKTRNDEKRRYKKIYG